MATTRVINRIPEWKLQAAVIERLGALERAGLPISAAGDMAAGRRSWAEINKAKATGLVAGEPDVRVYLPGGRICHIELKVGRAKPSDAQLARHERLAELGHTVIVLGAKTEAEAADRAEAFVREQLQ